MSFAFDDLEMSTCAKGSSAHLLIVPLAAEPDGRRERH
jgi:hypothetical protein